MKVVECVDNSKQPMGTLTVGRKYEVVNETEKTYIVINNLGDKHSAFKERFK